MPIEVTFEGSPLETKLRELETTSHPYGADVLLVMNHQKTRILERTARGVDVNESEFAPYSEKGPYYYYPNGPASFGPQNFNFSIKKWHQRRQRSAASFAKKTGGARRRGSVGVKFKSYGDFKRSLGRSVVDLMGPRAPHMLQAIVVRLLGAGEGVIGIYGPEADRAEGHNVGAGHLPRREWFGVSDSDEVKMGEELGELTAARMNKQ